MSENKEKKNQAGSEGAPETEPSIGKVSELREQDPASGRLVTRRDLARAAAALAISAAAEEALASGRGSISYVLCNKAFPEPVKRLAFSPGAGRLGAQSESGHLLVWNTQVLGKPMERFGSAGVASFTWGFKDTLLAIDREGRARCYDESGLRIFECPTKGVSLAGFSPSGHWLIILDSHNILQIWDTVTWREVRAFNAGAVVSTGLRSVGVTREDPPRVFLEVIKSVALIDPVSGQVKTYPEGARDGMEQVVVSASSEKAALLSDRRMTILTFPGGQAWGETDLGEIGRMHSLSPDFDHLVSVTARDEITVRDLRGRGSTVVLGAEVKGVTCLACSADPMTYAWGGRDGRVVVHRTVNGTVNASNLFPAFDPALGKIQEFVPRRARLAYKDCTCTCNAVQVTSETNNRMAQVWDEARQVWSTQTLPCGTPIPAGSICVCNCVSAGASPLWKDVCTCNLICTCDTQAPQAPSGGYTLYYWY
jgi:hypothetical protein